jgi:hypothetical protein
MDYDKSVELALNLGYEEIIDTYAYKGVYYIKNDKIWIHDIDALKLKLKVNSNEELELLGYDVQNYHTFSKYTNNMVDEFMKDLYMSITHSEGEATYLHDGMWLLPNGKIEER